MHYVLLFNETADELARRADPAAKAAYWGSWWAYMGAIAEAGAMVGGHGLQPPEVGTTLRVASDGTRQIHDGPFADTKEMLGGYVVLDLPDLDRALEWAARAPCVTAGSVEIRPVLPPAAMG
jgi:hypothetical protein